MKACLGVALAVAAMTSSVAMGQDAFPNPFAVMTTILFALETRGPVDMRVYDVSGRRVRALTSGAIADPGMHSVAWDGKDDHGELVPAGVYFMRLQSEGDLLSKPVILLR